LIVVGRTLSCRTGVGREMMRRSLGFRLFLLTAEPDEIQIREQQGVLDRFLPYAMALGCASRWSDRFSGLDSVRRMPVGFVPSHRKAPDRAALPGALPKSFMLIIRIK